ncbi:MAG: hypothetical protein ACPGVG_11930 [Mycobacterium sp.]
MMEKALIVGDDDICEIAEVSARVMSGLQVVVASAGAAWGWRLKSVSLLMQ